MDKNENRDDVEILGLKLTARIDKTDMEVDHIKESLTTLEAEGLVTRIAVIESELRTIREDVEVLPTLAKEISKLSALAKTAQTVGGIAVVVLVPFVTWFFNNVEALRDDVADQQQLINKHLTDQPNR